LSNPATDRRLVSNPEKAAIEKQANMADVEKVADATPAEVQVGTRKRKKHEKHHEFIGLPGYNHNGHKITKGIHPDGESGRTLIHPFHFMRITLRSSSNLSLAVNVLWPFVPAAIAINYARPDLHTAIFALNFIAMVPAANLIGFAGQELARKLPKVFGMSIGLELLKTLCVLTKC
jgi:Ca2+:H+ antiporter